MTTLDTAAIVRDLEAAGVERRQADAIAEGMRRAAAAGQDELVTKADVASLRAEIAQLETRLIKWGIGLALGAAGLAVAGIKLL